MEANRRYFPECGNTTATATVSAKVTATASVATAAAAASMVSEAFDASIANNNVNNNYTQGMVLLSRFLCHIGLKIIIIPFCIIIYVSQQHFQAEGVEINYRQIKLTSCEHLMQTYKNKTTIWKVIYKFSSYRYREIMHGLYVLLVNIVYICIYSQTLIS